MENLHEQLLRDEGMVLRAYKDKLGFLTIGIGHNLDAKGITKRVALIMLDDDIADAKTSLMGRWPWMRDLSPARLGAFINLCFNMGAGGLESKNPKMLARAEAGDWEGAAKELLDGPYKTQVGPRAFRLARQLREDRWV